ncbi:MAG: rhodanese-like domain-containing protein [Lautropia sp.]|nr:rhodanese-like domain-containing protein [Lautropia sp.]
MSRLSPAQLASWLADPHRPAPLLLDVREEWEFEHAHLDASRHVPLAMLGTLLADTDPDQPIVCICHHGMRSLQAVHFLSHHGFSDVHDLKGGLDAWSVEQDPSVPRY